MEMTGTLGRTADSSRGRTVHLRPDVGTSSVEDGGNEQPPRRLEQRRERGESESWRCRRTTCDDGGPSSRLALRLMLWLVLGAGLSEGSPPTYSVLLPDYDPTATGLHDRPRQHGAGALLLQHTNAQPSRKTKSSTATRQHRTSPARPHWPSLAAHRRAPAPRGHVSRAADSARRARPEAARSAPRFPRPFAAAVRERPLRCSRGRWRQSARR